MRKRFAPIALITALLVCASIQPAAPQQPVYDLLYATQSRDDGAVQYRVQVIDAVQGEVKDIETLHDEGSDAGWSPDGRFIYLVDGDRRRPDGRRLTLVDMTNGRRQRVTDRIVPSTCSTPLWWSPDGGHLAYLTVPDRQYGLHLLDTQDGSLRELPYEGKTPLYHASWSYDGRYLAYGERDVRIWDTRSDQVVNRLNADSIVPARWSPAADQVAYTSEQTGTIVVFNVQDGSEQQFAAYYVESWSPDGRYLLVVRKNYSSSFYQLLLADSVERTLQALDSTYAIWSADGRFLVYEAPDTGDAPPDAAVVYDVSNGSSRPLTGTSIYNYSIQWSPVGHWLAFLQAPNEQHTFEGFWVVDLDGQQYRHFGAETSDFIQDVPLIWSPDGMHLLVQTRDGLVVFDRQTGALHRIPEAPSYVTSPRWSPDGRYLAFVADALYVMDTHDFRSDRLADAGSLIGWRGGRSHTSLMYCGSG